MEEDMSALSLRLGSTTSEAAIAAAKRVAEFLARCINSAMHIYATRKAVAQVMELDERMLADIGLSRSEINSVVSGRNDPTRIPR
jgi:uncharacterized protein YjiS (DUF1127 family)